MSKVYANIKVMIMYVKDDHRYNSRMYYTCNNIISLAHQDSIIDLHFDQLCISNKVETTNGNCLGNLSLVKLHPPFYFLVYVSTPVQIVMHLCLYHCN